MPIVPEAANNDSTDDLQEGEARAKSPELPVGTKPKSDEGEILTVLARRILSYMRDRGVMIDLGVGKHRPINSSSTAMTSTSAGAMSSRPTGDALIVYTWREWTKEFHEMWSKLRKLLRGEIDAYGAKLSIGAALLQVIFDLKCVRGGINPFFILNLQDRVDEYLGCVAPQSPDANDAEVIDRVQGNLDMCQNHINNALEPETVKRFEPEIVKRFALIIMKRMLRQETYIAACFAEEAEAVKQHYQVLSMDLSKTRLGLQAIIDNFNQNGLEKPRVEFQNFLKELHPYVMCIRVYLHKIAHGEDYQRADLIEVLEMAKSIIKQIDYYNTSLIWSRLILDSESEIFALKRHIEKLMLENGTPPIQSNLREANLWLIRIYTSFYPNLTAQARGLLKFFDTVATPLELVKRLRQASSDETISGPRRGSFGFFANESDHSKEVLETALKSIAPYFDPALLDMDFEHDDNNIAEAKPPCQL